MIRVVCGIARDSQARVLVGCRPEGRDYPGEWEFPGGKVEEGESDQQALRREWHEELGIEIVPGQKVAEFTFPDHDPPFEIATYDIDAYFGKALSKHHTALTWVPWDKLSELKGTPHLQRFLDSAMFRSFFQDD